jgi:hypothetical protein
MQEAKIIVKNVTVKHKSWMALLCSSVLAIGLILPVGAFADSTPPSAPQSLQGVRYSATAGEIFWSPASDESTIVGYRITRDGESMGIRDVQSIFEGNLQEGRQYQYTVNAIDRFGNEGPALSVDVSSAVGMQMQGSLEALPELPDVPTPLRNQDPSNTSLSLNMSAARLALREGAASGVSVEVSVERNAEPRRVVQLSLEPIEGRDALNMRHVFSSTTLQTNQSGSVLSLNLDVGIAPLLHHERRFNVVADDGVSRTSTQIVLDITPSSAPDVYLLIGQSNMEVYSEVGSRERYAGGQDERNERIKQLNVQPNSRSVFYDDGMFGDEQRNVAHPLFVPAEDPLHEPRFIGIDGKEASFVGLGLTFAKSALTMSTADIYLVPAAWGATGFCANSNGELAWNAQQTPDQVFLGGTLLADRALTRLNMTLRETGGILRGILWHQGGADSNNPDCAASYAQNLAKLAARIRREARQDQRGSQARGDNASVPFIVATQSKGDDERARFSQFNPSKQQVDSAQRTVGSYMGHADFINNDDLVPPQYPCGQVSCVHYGAAALREQGRRFYAGIKQVWSEAGAYHY